MGLTNCIAVTTGVQVTKMQEIRALKSRMVYLNFLFMHSNFHFLIILIHIRNR